MALMDSSFEGFISLAEQEPLSPQDCRHAQSAIRYVRSALDRRESYIESHGLSREVWMPAGNWHEYQPFYQYAKELLGGNTLAIEFLRLYAQQFSGNALWAMTHCGGQALPPLDRALIEEKLRSISPDDWAIRKCQEFGQRLPDYLRISPPARFGEVGWMVDGILVNRDTIAYWERLWVLHRAGFLDRGSTAALHSGSRVLEIGGGYGALAWYIQEAVPNISYTIVDLPESLVYAAIYLEVLHPEATRLLPNYEFPEIVNRGEHFDLIINTLSMSEMTERQVRAYTEGIAKLIAPDGAFYEQNQDNVHAGMLNAQNIVAEYFERPEIFGGPFDREIHLMYGFANVWRGSKSQATPPSLKGCGKSRADRSLRSRLRIGAT